MFWWFQRVSWANVSGTQAEVRRSFYYLHLIYPMRTGLMVSNPPKTLLKLCRAVLQWSAFSVFSTSMRKFALQMMSDELTVISGQLWWRRGCWPHLSTLEAISGLRSTPIDIQRWRLMCSLYELKPKSEQLRVSIPAVSCERHLGSLKEHFAPVIALQGDYAFYRTIGIHLLLPQGVLLKCHFCQADYDKL